MSTDTKTPDAMHLRSVRLENVRAFGSTQTLRLTDDSGIVARWTLILGENGVGKTTLIQVMAAMRPIPAFENDDDLMKSDDAGPPTFIRAELSSHENEEIVGFLREDAIGNMLMSAVFVTETDALVEVGAEIVGKAGRDFEAASFSKAEYSLRADGPLIFGYGASRHAGRDNLSAGGNRTATTSLAAELVDLYDAEEVIENLAIAARLDPEGHQGKDFKRFEKLRIVVASLLPECSADAIEWRGPRLAGRDPYQSGVYVRTPSGMTAFAKLSSGYKVTFALIVDLAWRLYNTYPYSANPFEESAIVLIDEIELHLHPRWQRQLRSQLLAHFPNVQFVATTHSPLWRKSLCRQERMFVS